MVLARRPKAVSHSPTRRWCYEYRSTNDFFNPLNSLQNNKKI